MFLIDLKCEISLKKKKIQYTPIAFGGIRSLPDAKPLGCRTADSQIFMWVLQLSDHLESIWTKGLRAHSHLADLASVCPTCQNLLKCWLAQNVPCILLNFGGINSVFILSPEPMSNNSLNYA